MIKIQEHLKRADAEIYLDSLALRLWNSLNPKLAKGNNYKKISLIKKCEYYKEEARLARYRKKYANNDEDTARRHKAFFNFLLASNAKELHRIIVSRPTEFSTISNDIFNILLPADLYTGDSNNLSQTSFGAFLSGEVFNYKSFRSSDFCKDLFESIGFTSATCPYCNDIKLSVLKLEERASKATKKRAYLDLDHFYSKCQFPFFAVSFYNLIPSCHNCNSVDKRDKPFSIETHIHPYQESFEDFYRFRISLKTILGDPVDNIFIDPIVDKPNDRTVGDLNLLPKYQNHFAGAEKLADLFWKNKINIGTEFEAYFKDLILKGIPVERNDILGDERAKMNRDILKQLDINNILNIL